MPPGPRTWSSPPACVPHAAGRASRASDRVWHNSRAAAGGSSELRARRAPRRFVVVGAGQSAAEATEYLHRDFPTPRSARSSPASATRPADDSQLRQPDLRSRGGRHVLRGARGREADALRLPPQHQLLGGRPRAHRRTSTGGRYQEKVLGRQRLRMLQRVAGGRAATRPRDGVRRRGRVPARPARLTRCDADVVVYATGYRPADPLAGPRASRRAVPPRRRRPAACVRPRLPPRPDRSPAAAAIFVQGATEHAHGLSLDAAVHGRGAGRRDRRGRGRRPNARAAVRAGVVSGSGASRRRRARHERDERALVDLADAVQRQLVDEHDAVGQLERRDAALR